jgi:hypothetical protein
MYLQMDLFLQFSFFHFTICRFYGILVSMQTLLNMQINAKEPPSDRLFRDMLPAMQPLEFQWLEFEPQRYSNPPSALLKIAFDGSAYTFFGEYRPNWSQRDFQAVLARLERTIAAEPDTKAPLYPLVILPYLSEEHLNELVRRRISGLDLCGNGVVIVPKRWFVQRSGQPNRFRIEQSLKNPYRKLSSLVARTLLRQPRFRRLEDLHTEIERRGGKLSLALASRAVQRLEQELILMPEPGWRIRVVQPIKLLDQLLTESQPSRITRSYRGRVALSVAEFLPMLFHIAEQKRLPISITGIGSVTHYTLMSMEDVVYVYADDVDTLVRELPIKPGERFANLEIRVPHGPTVYFDTERDERGIRWASPVQTYLEMMQSTDARLQDSATALRTTLLADLQC